jgi:fibronectin-binding autotransporter adhesin
MTFDVSAPGERAADSVRHRGGRWRAVVFAGTAFAALALLAGPAAAQTWNGNTSTDWTTGSNWSSGTPPTGGNAVINSGNPVVLGVTGPAAGSTNGLTLGGTANLTIQNGSTLTSTGLGGVGSGTGSTVTVTVAGTGSQWSVGSQLSIGGGTNSHGTLTIENGAVVRALLTRLALSATGNGTLNIRSGGVLETGSLYTQAGTAQVNFDNATLRATGNNATFVYSQAGVNVNQFNIAAGGLTVDTNGFVIGAEGFSGVGGLTVTGTGALTLTQASTYAGETRVATGSTLNLSGLGSIAGSSGVVVDGTFDISAITAGDISTARLAGNGTVVLGTKSLTAAVISPGGDGSTGTLTLSGDYAGTGNTLLIDTVLGDDTSDTDRLIITGNTSGTTNVKVTNLGGVGGVTSDGGGIKIVDVGGTSAGIFSLLGDTVHDGEQAVIGGAYLYGLYQEAGDGDWYLRTIIDDEPVFQPAAPVIEAYVGAALQAFNTTESLVQRIGNRTLSDGNGLWGRIEAGRVSIAPDSTTGAGYDVTTWQLQAGLDGVLSRSDAGTLVGGVNAQLGLISAEISSASGAGNVQSTGYGLGATLTWYGSEGFYVDAQGKLTWFDSTLTSDALGTIVSGNGGFGYALSLEAGQEVALGDNWSVTPQAQLAYSSVDFDAFDSYGASVALADGDSLLGRLGLSVDHETEWQDDAGATGSIRLYGIANVSYEFREGTATSIGGDTLTSKADPLWGGIGLGGSIDWAGDALSLYGEANLGTSLNHLGDSYSFGVTAGIKGKL